MKVSSVPTNTVRTEYNPEAQKRRRNARKKKTSKSGKESKKDKAAGKSKGEGESRKPKKGKDTCKTQDNPTTKDSDSDDDDEGSKEPSYFASRKRRIAQKGGKNFSISVHVNASTINPTTGTKTCPRGMFDLP